MEISRRSLIVGLVTAAAAPRVTPAPVLAELTAFTLPGFEYTLEYRYLPTWSETWRHSVYRGEKGFIDDLLADLFRRSGQLDEVRVTRNPVPIEPLA